MIMKFINSIHLLEDFKSLKSNSYLNSLIFLKNLLNEKLIFDDVTFIIGQNGSGKTTLIESLAYNLGLNKFGGSLNFIQNKSLQPELSKYLTISKSIVKYEDAFFLRAENFFDLQNELDSNYGEDLKHQYTGGEKSFRELSHGQGFRAFFENRIRKNGVYIFDEPESALSIQSQIEFLFLIKELIKLNNQIIIITHSPIILSFPNAIIYEVSKEEIKKIKYNESFVYQDSIHFLKNYERFQNELLRE